MRDSVFVGNHAVLVNGCLTQDISIQRWFETIRSSRSLPFSSSG